MMHSFLGGNMLPAPQPSGYPADASLLDDLSRQIASATSRRLSRGSNGQRPGGAMRIMKPSSANNSPRSSIIQARRKTLMNDGTFIRRNPPVMDQGYFPTPAAEVTGDMFAEAAARSTGRPVSWHPTSHLVQSQAAGQVLQQAPAQQYPFPMYNEMELVTSFSQFPPTPAAYSGYTSPSSTFSPLSLPYSGLDAQQYFSPSAWAMSVETVPSALPSPAACQVLAEQPAPVAAQASQGDGQAATEWDKFVAHGFDRAASPPTPDNYPAAELPQPKLPAEESIPYQPLEDDEPEGEILIGMGLYDPPEKEVTDPTLESYRASVAHLLGSAYKYPEPTGKGLKLEDAWEPPEMDDEDEDEDKDESDDGEDRDAEGDEQEDDDENDDENDDDES